MITKETSKTTYLGQTLTKLGRNIKTSINADNIIDFHFPSSHKTADVFPREIMQKIFAQLENGYIIKSFEQIKIRPFIRSGLCLHLKTSE